MKRFRCHKVVEAAEISRVLRSRTVTYVDCLLCDDGQALFDVPADFFARGTPEPGDYLVRYLPDGYLSWSPKAVFEDGYSPE